MERTLDSIIVEYLTEHQKTLHWYFKTYSYAKAAYNEFRKHYAANEKVAVLVLDSENKADFPADMSAIKKLGSRVGDRILEMVEDKTIALAMKTEGIPNNPFTDIQVMNTSNAIEYDAAGPNSPSKNFYAVDWDNKKIVFSSPINREAYLVYRTTSVEVADASMVDEYATEFFKSYIHWKYATTDRRMGMASVEARVRREQWISDIHMYMRSKSDLKKRGVMDAAMRRLNFWAPGRAYFGGTALRN